MMTRKDYEKAAAIVRANPNGETGMAMLAGFVEFFRDDNPRFDVSRFVDACKPPKPAPVKRARLDRKGTAKPLAAIVAHAKPGDAVGPGITRPESFRDSVSGASVTLG